MSECFLSNIDLFCQGIILEKWTAQTNTDSNVHALNAGDVTEAHSDHEGKTGKVWEFHQV